MVVVVCQYSAWTLCGVRCRADSCSPSSLMVWLLPCFTGHGFAGQGFAGHGFAGHGCVGHGFAGHGFARHGFAGSNGNGTGLRTIVAHPKRSPCVCISRCMLVFTCSGAFVLWMVCSRRCSAKNFRVKRMWLSATTEHSLGIWHVCACAALEHGSSCLTGCAFRAKSAQVVGGAARTVLLGRPTGWTRRLARVMRASLDTLVHNRAKRAHPPHPPPPQDLRIDSEALAGGLPSCRTIAPNDLQKRPKRNA